MAKSEIWLADPVRLKRRGSAQRAAAHRVYTKPRRPARKVLARAWLYATCIDMICPVCETAIPRGTPHKCELKEAKE